MMQAPKNTKCNMVYKDYKHGLYLLELFVLWLKISKCNCTYNQCANCISIYLSCTSMPIVSNNIRKIFMPCCHDTGTFW